MFIVLYVLYCVERIYTVVKKKTDRIKNTKSGQNVYNCTNRRIYKMKKMSRLINGKPNMTSEWISQAYERV